VGTVLFIIGDIITLRTIFERIIYEADHRLRIERPKVVGLQLRSHHREDGWERTLGSCGWLRNEKKF
jgi:hypothetical protein